MTASGPRSFAACRAFLVELATHVDAPPGREMPVHARTCMSCGARWRAARAQARVLASLPKPALPADAARQVLDRVFDREVEQGETAVRALLARALPLVEAPADVEWVEPPTGGVLETWLRRWLPPVQAPGWLWARVRPASRTPTGVGPARWARVAAAAAILLTSVWVMRSWVSGPEKEGTSSVPGLVWLEEPAPSDAPFAPVRVLRELGR